MVPINCVNWVLLMALPGKFCQNNPGIIQTGQVFLQTPSITDYMKRTENEMGLFFKGQFLSPAVLQWEMSRKPATGVVNPAASPALMYFKVLRDSCLWSLTKITVPAVKGDKKPMTRRGKGENTHRNHKRLLHTSIKNHFNTVAAWMTNKWLSSLYDAAFRASGYWY